MLLAIDVGNTTTVVGVYRGDQLLRQWRLVSERRTSDELGLTMVNLLTLAGLDPRAIESAALCSVVPALDGIIQEALEQYLKVKVLRVSGQLDLGLELRLDYPAEVGADRVTNAVAALESYGAPVIVADFGTAITLDVVAPGPAYLGGVISPGLVTSMDALFGKTSKLPQVALEAPKSAIGHNTRDAIQSGVVFGTAAMIDGLARRIWDELGQRGVVVATGGHAAVVASCSQEIGPVDPWLTLRGLMLIHRRLWSRDDRGC